MQTHTHKKKPPHTQVNKFVVVDTIHKKSRFKIKGNILYKEKTIEKTNIKGKLIEEDTRRKKSSYNTHQDDRFENF